MISVSVIVPVPVPNTFSYLVPEIYAPDVAVGKRVVVPFGKSKLYTGIVASIEEESDYTEHLKEIVEVLDSEPIVDENQIRFWKWVSSYYMCHIGEVMQAALPAGLKLQSESRVLLRRDVNIDEKNLTDREFLIYEALEMQHILSIKDISSIIGIKTVHPIIKNLIAKEVIVIEEEIQEKFSEKQEKYVSLSENLLDENRLNEAIDSLTRAPAQMKLLLNFLSLKSIDEQASFSISKSGLKKKFNFGESVYNELISKGYLNESLEVVSRLDLNNDSATFYELSEAQNTAYSEIKTQFEQQTNVLFHGVTGSGKTEIYVRLIQEQLDQGKQVLYLLPEIALTTQLIDRLKKYFGNQVGVYHSKYTNNEKVEVWKAVMETDLEKPKYNIIIGARSCLYLPYKSLGLIIIDEEHEVSFKQFDPAPRYHARDAAIMLAHMFDAKCLLGSATPSIESFFNAKQGRYGYVFLKERFGGLMLPEVQCADIQQEQRKKTMQGHFSSLLIKAMEDAFSRNEQVILFQNRRGFSPMQECQVCAHVPQCVRCDVSLTYHKHFNELRCHYCGYSEKPKITCGNCGSVDLKLKGFGTEKIEEEVKILFPKIQVARMDFDTTRKKDSYKNIIQDFEEHNIDVLIGTQMVTKGLDFDNVGLVGIMNADNLLNWPDFRAHERAYHLMAQVSGRAGRKKRRGKVIIQSYNPHHNIIRNVMENDFESMYNAEILQRRNFYYPPYYRLIYLTIVHSSVDLVNAGAQQLVNQISKKFGKKRVLGPEFPAVARIRMKYHKNIIVKIDRDFSINKAKKELKSEIDLFLSNEHFRPLRVIADVDPA